MVLQLSKMAGSIRSKVKRVMLVGRPPTRSEPSGSGLRHEEQESSWRPVTRRPKPRKLILLGVMGGVWTLQDPGNDRLYRCEVDPDGSERWFFKVVRAEREWISQSDAARLIGVSRQAIRGAIVHGRLCTMNSNGRPMVRRAEVLGLKIDPNKRRSARKQSPSTDQT
jgi:hypothetical protein